MTDNKFEEFFRNKLQDHPSPVPDDMWERIISDKKKDRGIFIFWKGYLLGGAILICLITGAYFIWNNHGMADKSKIISGINTPAVSEKITVKKAEKDSLQKALTLIKKENPDPGHMPKKTGSKASPILFTNKTQSAKPEKQNSSLLKYNRSAKPQQDKLEVIQDQTRYQDITVNDIKTDRYTDSVQRSNKRQHGIDSAVQSDQSV